MWTSTSQEAPRTLRPQVWLGLGGLPDVRFEEAGGVGAPDGLLQASFSSHQTMPERHGRLLDASSAGDAGL